MRTRTVRVEKKNHAFVNLCEVAENAIEKFKKFYGDDKIYTFWDRYTTINPNGTGEILAFTTNGFEYIRVD